MGLVFFGRKLRTISNAPQLYAHNRIMGRSLLLLFSDGENLVLYSKRFYGDARYGNALLSMPCARDTPRRSAEDKTEAYGRWLVSFGGIAPWQ